MSIKKTIQGYCKDKEVLLVGNSSSLLGKQNGSKIDKFDVVVRMNHGYPRSELASCTGQKTDIWICAFNNLEKQVIEYQKFQPQYAIRLNNKTHVHPKMQQIFLMWDMANWHQVKQATHIKKYPSTGLVSIYFFLYFIGMDQITLTGFDFFKTSNFYKNQITPNLQARRWHEPNMEERYIKGLIREHKVNLL